MRLENYIHKLLFHHKIIVVPGMGAFCTQKYNANIHSMTGIIYPPKKVITFNDQLGHDDQLLINTVAENEGLFRKEAKERIEKIVSHWVRNLELKQILVLENIGRLWLDERNKIVFRANPDIEYNANSYGLKAISATKVVKEKPQVILPASKLPIIEDRRVSLDNYLDQDDVKEQSSIWFWISILLMIASLIFVAIQFLDLGIWELGDYIDTVKEQKSTTPTPP